MPDSLLERIKSRKFLLAVSSAITGVLVALFPGHETEIATTVAQITGATLTILSVLGWIVVEGSIDKANVAAQGRSESELTAAAERIVNQRRAEGLGKQNSGSLVSGSPSSHGGFIRPHLLGALALLGLVVTALLAGGCVQGVPVRPVKTFADTVGEDHAAILTGELDPETLTAEEKRTRLDYIAEFQALVDDYHADRFGGPVIDMPE